MTTYYVGAGGNDSNNGTTWAQRKLTLNGAEDIPVVAGDTVYVAPGTYRELLTCDVSGSAESGAITYIGDYDGTHTDGVGGIVRISGSDDDIATARDYCINGNSKTYRIFDGLFCNGQAKSAIVISGSNCTVQNCYLEGAHGDGILRISGAVTEILVSNCFVNMYHASNTTGIIFVHSTAYSANSTVQNCIVIGGMFQYYGNYTGGLTFKNCTALQSGNQCFRFLNQNASYPSTITNSIIIGNVGVYANIASVVTEDYNSFNTSTSRTNVDVGAHSNTYLPFMEARWFFEMINGGGLITPFDLASYSGLINVAGTSPTTADMRGTTVQGTQREWGALEYDSTLDIEAGTGGGLLTNPGMTGGMRG